MSDAIDSFLDTFGSLVVARRSDAAAILDEADLHLRETQERLIAEAVDPGEAAVLAVQLYGEPEAIAASYTRDLPRRADRLARDATIVLLTIGGAGLVRVGLSLATFASGRRASRGTEWPGPLTTTQLLVGALGLLALETRWMRGAANPGVVSPLRRPALAVPFAIVGVALAAIGGLALGAPQPWIIGAATDWFCAAAAFWLAAIGLRLGGRPARERDHAHRHSNRTGLD